MGYENGYTGSELTNENQTVFEALAREPEFAAKDSDPETRKGTQESRQRLVGTTIVTNPESQGGNPDTEPDTDSVTDNEPDIEDD